MTHSDAKANVRYLIPGDTKPIYIASQGGAGASSVD